MHNGHGAAPGACEGGDAVELEGIQVRRPALLPRPWILERLLNAACLVWSHANAGLPYAFFRVKKHPGFHELLGTIVLHLQYTDVRGHGAN